MALKIEIETLRGAIRREEQTGFERLAGHLSKGVGRQVGGETEARKRSPTMITELMAEVTGTYKSTRRSMIEKKESY